jgi:1-deoxy-D-xylulose 5-phosphate reductoisomerase
MTAAQFRRIALSLDGAEEKAHMNHPDFRVNGKIFATLGYPDNKHGMVKLPPECQHEFTHNEPEAFTCVKGAWGRQGATSVLLPAANESSVKNALEIAWRKASNEHAQKGSQGRRRGAT